MTSNSIAAGAAPGLRLWLLRTRWEWAACGALAVALALYPAAPLAAWLAPLVFCAGYCALALARLPRRDLLWVVACCVAALLLQSVVLAVWGMRDPQSSPDPRQFLVEARAVADSWRGGVFPELYRKGSLPYLGTMHTGYQRVLAGLFYVGGDRVSLGIGLNAFCVALLPMLVCLATRTLLAGSGSESRASLAAATLCAAYPAFLFWAAWLHKDILLVLVFLMAVVLLLDALHRGSPAAAAGFFLVTGFCITLRAYAGLSLLVAGCAYGVALLPRRRVLWALVYGILVLGLLVYTTRGGRMAGQLLASAGALLPDEVRTQAQALRSFAAGIPRLLLGPYGWVRAFEVRGQENYYGLYPGMWFLYLLVYPLAIAGFWECLRGNRLLAVVPVTCVVIAALLFLMTYGGMAFRQRLYLEPFLLMLAGAGWGAPRLRWIAGAWYGGLFLFAAVQLATLSVRY